MGNHEQYTYALGPGLWVPYDDDFSTYLDNVDLPGNERYYSFSNERILMKKNELLQEIVNKRNDLRTSVISDFHYINRSQEDKI